MQEEYSSVCRQLPGGYGIRDHHQRNRLESKLNKIDHQMHKNLSSYNREIESLKHEMQLMKVDPKVRKAKISGAGNGRKPGTARSISTSGSNAEESEGPKRRITVAYAGPFSGLCPESKEEVSRDEEEKELIKAPDKGDLPAGYADSGPKRLKPKSASRGHCQDAASRKISLPAKFSAKSNTSSRERSDSLPKRKISHPVSQTGKVTKT